RFVVRLPVIESLGHSFQRSTGSCGLCLELSFVVVSQLHSSPLGSRVDRGIACCPPRILSQRNEARVRRTASAGSCRNAAAPRHPIRRSTRDTRAQNQSCRAEASTETGTPTPGQAFSR